MAANMHLEVREPGGGIDGVHYIETDAREGASPTLLITLDVEPEALIDCLIKTLRRAVGLYNCLLNILAVLP